MDPREPAETSHLLTAQLFAAARREVVDDDPDKPVPALVALHERPTRQVFDTAARLLSDTDPVSRQLGARVLRELGPEGAAGRRPFSAEAVPLLRDRLQREDQPRVLAQVISALGYNGAREALAEVVSFAAHPDWRVRFHVAAAIPSLVDPDHVDTAAVTALRRLCRDSDAHTRYYALYALVEELPGINEREIMGAVAERRNDLDAQVRRMARIHQHHHC